MEHVQTFLLFPKQCNITTMYSVWTLYEVIINNLGRSYLRHMGRLAQERCKQHTVLQKEFGIWYPQAVLEPAFHHVHRRMTVLNERFLDSASPNASAFSSRSFYSQIYLVGKVLFLPGDPRISSYFLLLKFQKFSPSLSSSLLQEYGKTLITVAL